MIPSEFTIPFSEFFGLWYSFATMACILSIPLCVILLFDWQDNNKKLLIVYFRNYFKKTENNKIGVGGCLFLLFFYPPILFYHGKLIINGKIDPLFILIHLFGVLAAEGLVAIAENKYKKYGPSPIPENEPFESNEDFSSNYSEPKGKPHNSNQDDDSKAEKEKYNPEHDFDDFDPERFKSNWHKARYAKYNNMANDPNASANERQMAIRKMIEMDRDEN